MPIPKKINRLFEMAEEASTNGSDVYDAEDWHDAYSGAQEQLETIKDRFVPGESPEFAHITSRADFDSTKEKAHYIRAHGREAYESLPRE